MYSGNSSKWRLTCDYDAHWAEALGLAMRAALGVWMPVIQWDEFDVTVVLFVIDKRSRFQ
jgi:hypothetical protein